MKQKQSTQNIFLFTAGFLTMAMIGLITTSRSLDITAENIQNYLLGAVLFCIALVTVTVFQSFRISEDAQLIAESLAKDMVDASHNLFTELYRASPVPYLLVDKEGTIASVNRAGLRLFQVNEGVMEGKNIFEIIDGDDADHMALFSGKFDQDLSINDEEVNITRADGVKRWVLFSLFSFRDEAGKKRGVIAMVDITRQKEIDQAKSEFVSLASHQLRTPIAAMKWNVELLVAKNSEHLSENQLKYISKVERNLNRMDTLVQDFLSVSKFELGTYATDHKRINVVNTIEMIVEEHAGAAELRKIVIKREYGEGIRGFLTDTHLFRMIVGNLLSNAVKYSPDNGKVQLRAVEANDALSITIVDTGIGIPKSEQNMLFTKVFRASNARTEVPDGTGLGLYIVDQAVQLLGGTINCVSEQNVGTTFTVILPR
ncbi:MAG: PAS domain-containing sensor histidine kinase [Candidatus Pacebacteria bacterium]|nr:PAS domain-containing sensor histidine kinase [Candidatus Paceibacterota bacterium]